MKKKGFTLVELLAVIAILAILVILALPNVIGLYNSAKQESFLTEAKGLFSESEKKFISDNISSTDSNGIYCRSNTDSINPLDLSGRKINYYIKTNSNGIVNSFVVWDENMYIAEKGEKIDTDSLNSVLTITDDVKNATCKDILEIVGFVNKIDYSKISLTLGNTETKILTMSLDTSYQDVGEIKYKIYIRSAGKTVELSSTDYTNNYYIEYSDYTEMDQYSGFEVTAIINGEEFSKKSIGPACFVSGTKVKTKNGYKNIENINVGDLIYSYNLDTNNLELNKVTKTIISQTIETYLITIENETFEVTPRHELYIIDKGWVRAYDIKVGDKMLNIDGSEIMISSIENKKYSDPIRTYNLTVNSNSNYFVTDIQVLVHNMGSDTWIYYDEELLK